MSATSYDEHIMCTHVGCDGHCFSEDGEVCELHCRVEGDELYRSAPRVVDGTPCDAMSNDVCVDGVCQVCLRRRSSGSNSGNNNNVRRQRRRWTCLWPLYQDKLDRLVNQNNQINENVDLPVCASHVPRASAALQLGFPLSALPIHHHHQ